MSGGKAMQKNKFNAGHNVGGGSITTQFKRGRLAGRVSERVCVCSGGHGWEHNSST